MANECVCSVLCTTVQPFLQEKWFREAQIHFCPMSLVPGQTAFHSVFPVSSYVGRRATSGLSLGTMPGLGQLSPSEAHTLEHCESEGSLCLCHCPGILGRKV